MRKKALILGGYGAVGFECARTLAMNGYDIINVCRIRRSRKEEYVAKKAILEQYGATILEVRGNAADEDCIYKVCEELRDYSINCFIHAIADGNVGNIFTGERILKTDSFIHTFKSMCLSFVIWIQELLKYSILDKNSYIFGFTSEGTIGIFPNYVANGVAKAGLEVLCKYMANELFEQNIYVNIFRAGIMDTNAINALDSYENFVSLAQKNNYKITNPEKVAEKIMEIIQNKKIITGQILDV